MTVQDLNCVLVPVDFSEESLAAVDVALELAREPASLVVMHVLTELLAADTGTQHVQKALQEKLSAEKYRGVRLECAVGDPGHCIAEEATRASADLIVMPSHGRHGVKRVLLGSVAERVLRLADCSVLILKRPRK